MILSKCIFMHYYSNAIARKSSSISRTGTKVIICKLFFLFIPIYFSERYVLYLNFGTQIWFVQFMNSAPQFKNMYISEKVKETDKRKQNIKQETLTLGEFFLCAAPKEGWKRKSLKGKRLKKRVQKYSKSMQYPTDGNHIS